MKFSTPSHTTIRQGRQVAGRLLCAMVLAVVGLGMARECAAAAAAAVATPNKETFTVADSRSADGIYERKVTISGMSKDEITFFLKLPPGAANGTVVKGVFAFCTPNATPARIRQAFQMEDGVDPQNFPVAQLAAKYQMAMVSWTTFADQSLYDKAQSTEALTSREQDKIDKQFDQLARKWRQAMDGFIAAHKLPDRQWMFYGLSQGAQWAHRIALRQPDLFAAVHIHISSSYDVLTRDGSSILWLVTTGELEHGYPAAKKFYADAKKLGYNMIFQAEPKLSHQNSADANRLSIAFFDYAIRRAQTGAVPPAGERVVGNLLTNEFYPLVRESAVPVNLRVNLPSRAIAEKWGVLAK